jgi:hypothetical protein
MATVFLLSAGASVSDPDPESGLDLDLMRESAALDVFGRHTVTDDPSAADLILFVETSIHGGKYFEHVRSHGIYRHNVERSYVYCATDKIVPLVPGVFVSLEERWNWASWVRPGHYVNVKVRDGADEILLSGEPDLLFSFVGSSRTHPVRREVVKLRHPDAEIVDTSKRIPSEIDPPDDSSRWQSFASGIRNSAFVLCPRGGGTATFRLFETMMLGRVPVIISDQWVPPIGPAWDMCSIRVPERQVRAIPSLLEHHRERAAGMGTAARETWLEWFSPEVSFHRIVESTLALDELRPRRRGIRRLVPRAQMVRPYHTARWIASSVFGHTT